MSRVELIYDEQCPNVEDARAQLRQALHQVNLPVQWQEWDRNDPSAPDHVHRCGSPTILIDGEDVAGTEAQGSNCCRLYSSENGLRGVPSVDTITAALGPRQSGGVAGSLGVVPAIVAGSMPTLACPACWPAYAGVLGSVGLGFLIDSTSLMPIVAMALLVALAALVVGARRRHAYGPLVIGLIAGVAVLMGRFWLDSAPITYGGVGIFIVASVWNAWPKPSMAKPSLKHLTSTCCGLSVATQEPNNG